MEEMTPSGVSAVLARFGDAARLYAVEGESPLFSQLFVERWVGWEALSAEFVLTIDCLSPRCGDRPATQGGRPIDAGTSGMTEPSASARVLRGKLGRIRKTKSTIDFFFSDVDEKKIAATGAAAAAMGMSGVAAGMVAMSLDETSEEVEKIDFEVGGVPVQGLFWAFPFEDGDEVDVVVEETPKGLTAFAVARPKDRIISMYPYAWSGRLAFAKRSLFVWALVCLTGMLIVFLVLLVIVLWEDIKNIQHLDQVLQMTLVSGAAGGGILAIIGFNIARKFYPFAKISTEIYKALGLANPERLNLRKFTRASRKPGDPPDLGDIYFRY